MWDGVLAVLLGIFVGGIGSYFLTQIQIKENRKVAGGELLIAFDARLDRYQKVHENLRPNGNWAKGEEIGDGDWIEVDGYMGAFERLNILINTDLIPKDIACSFYQYRLKNIVGNKEILKYKINNKDEDWKNFIAVCRSLGVEIPKTELG